jgi:hypothetical protein
MPTLGLSAIQSEGALSLSRPVASGISWPWNVGSFQAVRAKLRVLVRRILRNHGCPTGKAEIEATQTVLEQADVLSGLCATT